MSQYLLDRKNCASKELDQILASLEQHVRSSKMALESFWKSQYHVVPFGEFIDFVRQSGLAVNEQQLDLVIDKHCGEEVTAKNVHAAIQYWGKSQSSLLGLLRKLHAKDFRRTRGFSLQRTQNRLVRTQRSESFKLKRHNSKQAEVEAKRVLQIRALEQEGQKQVLAKVEQANELLQGQHLSYKLLKDAKDKLYICLFSEGEELGRKSSRELNRHIWQLKRESAGSTVSHFKCKTLEEISASKSKQKRIKQSDYRQVLEDTRKLKKQLLQQLELLRERGIQSGIEQSD